MMYEGICTRDVHPATWEFLKRHKLSVTLEGPGR
jgi:hypothetical protein